MKPETKLDYLFNEVFKDSETYKSISNTTLADLPLSVGYMVAI